MTTNNSVNVPLSGNTGTGNFVGANTPTLITPVLGAATGTSIAFSPTTGGIIGTTAADNAGAGKVGEVISSAILLASAVTVTTASVQQNLTSITLSAGDWDVVGNILFVPAATTTTTAAIGGISIVSNNLPDQSLWTEIFEATLANEPCGFTVPSQRINVSGSTIVYLVGDVAFASSTMKMCGSIYARRAR